MLIVSAYKYGPHTPTTEDRREFQQYVEGLEGKEEGRRETWPTQGTFYNPPIRAKRSALPVARSSSDEFLCYDMEDPNNQITKYSLNNLTDCHRGEDRFLPAKPVEAIVLHLNTETDTQVHSCRLTYTKKVNFCDSWFYRHYGSKYIAIEKPIYLR